MLNLINQIVARAKANRQRIVLPEGTEERTLKAANMILTDEVADLILLGKPDEINELATKWGLGNIGKATIIDPETSPKHEEYAQLLCELRKKKGIRFARHSGSPFPFHNPIITHKQIGHVGSKVRLQSFRIRSCMTRKPL